MKTCILALAALSFTGILRADELDDAYAALKEASSKNDADTVKSAAAEASKLARAEAARSKPEQYNEEDWKKRVEFAKGVDTFSEYALATAAAQPNLPPAKVIELVDALLAQNAKSTYTAQCTPAYLAALSKTSQDKMIEGATKLVNGNPNNEDALLALSEGLMAKNRADQAFTYATRLVNVMKTKAKPEGVSEAEWNSKKATLTGRGYYTAGVTGCMRQLWKDCDSNLKAAIPLVGSQPAFSGPLYFYLGLANYQISQITTDRTKLQDAVKYTQQAANIAGPMQASAKQNLTAFQQKLGAPVAGKR